MSLNQMENFTFNHINQLDAIYTEYTASQIKALFDSRGAELRAALNLLITTLSSTNGADNIGSNTITDLDGTTIQAMLQSIRDKLKSTTDGTSGADFVNATAINGVNGNTVQSLLEGLKVYTDSLTADNIESTPIASGSGSTVQEQLAWLLNQIVIASTGSIVDGSIGEVKLSPTLLNKINLALSNEGLLSLLETIDKSSLVNAINELLSYTGTNTLNINENANNIATHETTKSTNTVLGHVKQGTGVTIADGVLSVATGSSAFKKSNSTFTTRGTTHTVTDTFCTANSLVTISITSVTKPQGSWTVNSLDGLFTITSTATETVDITFDYFIQKAVI